MESQGGYLYGSTDTGFDLVSFLKKPSVLLKVLGIVSFQYFYLILEISKPKVITKLKHISTFS